MKCSRLVGSLASALVLVLASSAIAVLLAQRATRPVTSSGPGLALEIALVPDNRAFPGLDVGGYSPTTPVTTPGPLDHHGVLIECDLKT
jgi:hypothetical protein